MILHICDHTFQFHKKTNKRVFFTANFFSKYMTLRAMALFYPYLPFIYKKNEHTVCGTERFCAIVQTNSSCSLQHMFMYTFSKYATTTNPRSKKKTEIIKSTRSPKKLKFDNIGRVSLSDLCVYIMF